MTPDWHILIPHTKGLVVVAALVAAITVHDTVSLGSILVAAGVIVAGGVFTLRNNLKSFWKNLAEERGEQVKQLEKELHDKGVEMAAFAEDQRNQRHQLKTELATVTAQLAVEAAKHDLSTVTIRLDSLEQTLADRWQEFAKIEGKLDRLIGFAEAWSARTP